MASRTEKPLGLHNVVSVSMGLIVSMSCLVSLGQGAGEAGLMFIPAMAIALLLNMCSAACMAELNALMPNATGGLVQYTLAGLGPLPTLVTMVGGYLICNILCGGVEAAIFGSVMVETIPLAIPAAIYPTIVSIIVAVAALKGVDIFAKLQDFVSYLLLVSMIVLGLIGAFGLGTGAVVAQPAAVTTDPAAVVSAVGVAS